MGAVSWLLRRNVSQSLACSDQPAAAEPVPAPLSLVNFPLAAVDSKVPPLEISRFRHGLWGGLPLPTWPRPLPSQLDLAPRQDQMVGFGLVNLCSRSKGGPRCQACARLSARGGVEGLAGSRPGAGEPQVPAPPQVLSGRGGYCPQPTALTPPCSLLVILAKYGLDGRKDSRVVSSNFVDHGPDDESLEDPRLEKLWHKVPSAESHPRPWRPARGSLSHPAGLPPRPRWPVVPCLPHLECLLL